MRNRALLLCAVILTLWAPLAAQKKSWKDASVSLGDIKLHYIEAGAGEQTIVFVPGLATTAEVWKEQIPYFAGRGFRVLAIDPRSHGQTSKTDGGNTYQQHAADLHAFLMATKAQNCTLVGWSAGVTTLLEYMSSPEAVPPEKLVLVDGAPVGLKDDDFPSGRTLQQARNAFMAIQDDREKAASAVVRGMFLARPTELVVKELSEGWLKTPAGALMALYFDLVTGDRRPALMRISVPTLIIVPDTNRLLGEYYESKIKKSRLEVVTEAGHALFLEKPQTFNQLLEAFAAQP
jgi:non-heme chloroperoxidase